ncbi:MAG TPA: WD40 repeat domain-containing protein [Rectinemataceae bacterium]|nr:WD40 repeat domain-containing protein [Rectinemataceae bacterium]
MMGILFTMTPGCRAPETPNSAEALVTLSFGAQARAFAPVSAAVASYSILASGPEGLTVASSSNQASQTLRLAPGTWSVAVEGLAADGRRLVAGSIVLNLGPGDKQSAAIVLLPEGGTGSLALAWSTIGVPSGSISLSGQLSALDKASIPLLATGLSGSLAISDLPSGSWNLSLLLSNEGGKLAGLADSILIVAGCETTVSLVFEPPSGSIALSLIGPSFTAETLATRPPLRRMAAGAEARFAIPSTAGTGSWYGNGELILASGGEVSLRARAEGEERIDWVSTEPFTARSAQAKLIASPPVAFGPLSWNETLLRADFGATDAARGLDGCRDLAFSPDNASLFLAGKDSGAVGDFSLHSGLSPLPTASLLSSAVPALASASLVASTGSDSLLALGTSNGSLISLTRSADGVLCPGPSLVRPDFTTATALKVSPDGKRAWIASEGGNAIYGIDLASGAPVSSTILVAGGSPGFELLSRPTALAISPDASTLVLGSSGDDSLWFCSIDPASGALGLQACLTKFALSSVASLSDPVDLSFSPDGRSVFALSYYGKSIIRIDRNAAGNWEASTAAKSGTAPILGFDYPKHLALSPDGTLLVVSGSGASDGLAAFSVGNLGQLDWLACLLPDGTEGHPVKPGALAFSADGLSLAAACPDSDSLYMFTRSVP